MQKTYSVQESDLPPLPPSLVGVPFTPDPQWNPKGKVAASLDIRLEDAQEPTLSWTLTNRSAEEPLRLFPYELPGWLLNLELVATVGDEAGPELEHYDSTPMCTTLMGRFINIPPGGHETASLHLRKKIKGLDEALKKSNVLLRWIYRLDIPGQGTLWMNGSLVIPRSKAPPGR